MKLRLPWMLAGWLFAGATHAAEAAPPPEPAASPTAATADASPPSDESLHRLLEVTQKRALLDSMRAQMQGFVKESLAQAFRDGAQGRSVSTQQQAILDRMRAKLTALMDQSLNWETLEPIYLRAYRASFTQSEVDSLIAFYQTPAGQALLTKMPLVMQNMIGEMKSIMLSLQQQVRAVREQAVREMQNLPSAPRTNSG
jgi:hypothetical protein